MNGAGPIRRGSQRAVRALRRLLQREDGLSPIEFAMVAPLMFGIFLAAVESGMTLTRKVMLERAVDLATREVRLGMLENPSHDALKERICAYTALLPDCEANLALDLTPIDISTWAAPDTPMRCVDRSQNVTPINAFSPAGSAQPTLVRACLVVDLIFSFSGIGMRLPTDGQGGFALTAVSFYINEPMVGS